MTPQRIQRKRTAGWRIPGNTVCVSRPSRWGNPYTVTRHGGTWNVYDATDLARGDGTATVHGAFVAKADALAHAVAMFDLHTGPFGNHEYDRDTLARLRRELTGRNLACWCPTSSPCHADSLLRIANEVTW